MAGLLPLGAGPELGDLLPRGVPPMMLVGTGCWQEASASCRVDLTMALLMCPRDKIPASPKGMGPGGWGSVTTCISSTSLEACQRPGLRLWRKKCQKTCGRILKPLQLLLAAFSERRL